MSTQGVQGVRWAIAAGITAVSGLMLYGRTDRIARYTLDADEYEATAKYSLMMRQHGSETMLGRWWQKAFDEWGISNIYGPFGIFSAIRRGTATAEGLWKDVICSWPTPFLLAGLQYILPKNYKLHNLVKAGAEQIWKAELIGKAGSGIGWGLGKLLMGIVRTPGLLLKGIVNGGAPGLALAGLTALGIWQFTRILNGNERDDVFEGDNLKWGYKGNHVDVGQITLTT